MDADCGLKDEWMDVYVGCYCARVVCSRVLLNITKQLSPCAVLLIKSSLILVLALLQAAR
jgi:hypothetical protein